MSESPQPTFAIEKIYLKDLSVEVPNAPEVFLEREAPTVDVNVGSSARAVQDGLFEVVLTVTITAKIKDKTLFLYVRETISAVTSRAGFTPVVLAPMTFEGIYQQQMQQMQQLQPQPGAKPN